MKTDRDQTKPQLPPTLKARLNALAGEFKAKGNAVVAHVDPNDAHQVALAVAELMRLQAEVPAKAGEIIADELERFVIDGLVTKIFSGLFASGGVVSPQPPRLAGETVSAQLHHPDGLVQITSSPHKAGGRFLDLASRPSISTLFCGSCGGVTSWKEGEPVPTSCRSCGQPCAQT